MVLPLVLVSVLSAPMPGEAENQQFREAFDRGEVHYKAGDFGAAIASFREADRLRVTPEVAFDLARCFERLGDEAFATYYYRLYLRRAPTAPDTLTVAERVGNTLARVESEGHGFLELDAQRAQALTVNGRRYPAPPVALFLPPGDYEVKAEFPSGLRQMSVQVRTGKTTTVHFEPVSPPLVPLEQALTQEMVEKGLDSARAVAPSRLRVASYAVAALGLASVAAALALGSASAADAAAAQDHSRTASQAQDLANSANRNAVTANLCFGAGGAMVAGATLMFLFSMPEPGPAPAAARP